MQNNASISVVRVFIINNILYFNIDYISILYLYILRIFNQGVSMKEIFGDKSINKEQRISLIAKTSGAVGVVTLLLTGCSGEQKTADWTIGAECAENANLRVLEVSAPSNSSLADYSNIVITCAEENGQDSAPASVTLLNGEGTVVKNPGVKFQELEINATYFQGGFDDNQNPRVSWAVAPSENPNIAIVNVDSVDKINSVEVSGTTNS